MRGAAILVALTSLFVGLANGPASAQRRVAVGALTSEDSGNLAVPAPKWTDLFDRQSGWTGADGIYSIPLSGDERPGSAARAKTFWVFSDTFIGEVDAFDQRLPGTTLVNNTMAILNGPRPRQDHMRFLYKTDSSGQPAPMVVPGTSSEQWFWPNDGVAVSGTGYLYCLRMKPASGGVFDFAVDGISLLTTDVDGSSPLANYTQVDAPLYLPANDARGEVYFGQALMPNTGSEGAPEPDGYLYVYGVQNDLSKHLLVARVLPDRIGDFSAYRFWNGTGWDTAIAAAEPVTGRLSSEFSVSPLPDGRYILVFQLDGLSSHVAVRFAPSPVGPWTAPTIIWTAPEADLTPNTFVYNAKAHPHLSRPGELLISYNVNTFKFTENLLDADIYHPRFIRLAMT